MVILRLLGGATRGKGVHDPFAGIIQIKFQGRIFSAVPLAPEYPVRETQGQAAGTGSRMMFSHIT